MMKQNSQMNVAKCPSMSLFTLSQGHINVLGKRNYNATAPQQVPVAVKFNTDTINRSEIDINSPEFKIAPFQQANKSGHMSNNIMMKMKNDLGADRAFGNSRSWIQSNLMPIKNINDQMDKALIKNVRGNSMISRQSNNAGRARAQPYGPHAFMH